MAGIIKYMASIDNASGKIFGKKERFTSVSRSFGNRQRGCAATGKRNLNQKPYCEDEQAQHDAFRTAAGHSSR